MRLLGLELWDGLVNGTPLHENPAGLQEFLHHLRAGTAQTASRKPLVEAAGFQKLILTGGDATPLGWPGEVVIPGPYAARPGAEIVWAEHGWRNPAAIDLGQSRVKWFTRDDQGTIERAGRHFRDLIHEALPANYDGLLLALPTAIDANGNAEGCTYEGLHGPIESLFADLQQPWVARNDALLTARGHPPATNEKTLILTIGFGVGAAIWLP
jgi:hypothetical protein